MENSIVATDMEFRSFTQEQLAQIEKAGFCYTLKIPLTDALQYHKLPVNIIDFTLAKFGKGFCRISMLIGRFCPLADWTSANIAVGILDERKLHPTMIVQTGFSAKEAHAFFLSMPHYICKTDIHKLKIVTRVNNGDFSTNSVGGQIIVWIDMEFCNQARLFEPTQIRPIILERSIGYSGTDFNEFKHRLIDMQSQSNLFSRKNNNKSIENPFDYVTDENDNSGIDSQHQKNNKWVTHTVGNNLTDTVPRSVIISQNNQDKSNNNIRQDQWQGNTPLEAWSANRAV